MTKDNLINHIFNHNTAETLPIPPKTILLEEGKRGCVKMMRPLFFYDKAPTFPSRGFVIT